MMVQSITFASTIRAIHVPVRVNYRNLLDEFTDFTYSPRTRTHLLNLGRGALEELDVARADHVTMFGQRARRVDVVGEEHECVAGGATVGLVHEQHAVLGVEYVTRTVGVVAAEELQLQDTTHRNNRHASRAP